MCFMHMYSMCKENIYYFLVTLHDILESLNVKFLENVRNVY